MADIVREIVDGGLCHGCGACVSALGPEKLTMAMSGAGYLRPKAQSALTTDDQAIVRNVCSGLTIAQDAGVRHYDRTWGPIVTLETGYATDLDVRFKGSSGGAMTSILLHLLETKQVDFVVQTRASDVDPLGNLTSPSYSREEVLAASGSRYAPSSPLADLERYLSTGERFAFVGKPCDVAALRMMAKHDVRIDRQIPYALSFFCAGVPSKTGAQAVLKKLGVAESDVGSFVYRGNGWPGLARATRHDGSEESMDYHSSWGTILSRHLQFRCKICPEGIGEFADIACADAWYGKDGYPDFAERDGRSLIVARTPAGRALLDAMVSRQSLVVEPLDKAEVRLMQPYQYDRRSAVLVRLCAMVMRGRRIPRYKGLHLVAAMVRSSPVFLLRNFLGTFRRIPLRVPLK